MNILKTTAVVAGVLLFSTSAYASPIAVAGAQAIAGAAAEGGTGVGIGEGGSSNGSVSNESGDSRSLGVALGQAPTAVSGICGKGNQFAFGALAWTDFSSKCFNYMIAIEAAKRGEWSLANQWVERADGM